jgi:hypothetical protein
MYVYSMMYVSEDNIGFLLHASARYDRVTSGANCNLSRQQAVGGEGGGCMTPLPDE